VLHIDELLVKHIVPIHIQQEVPIGIQTFHLNSVF